MKRVTITQLPDLSGTSPDPLTDILRLDADPQSDRWKGKEVTDDDLKPLFEAVRLMQRHAASIATPDDWHTEAAQKTSGTAAECSVIAREAYNAIASKAGLHTFDQKSAYLFQSDGRQGRAMTDVSTKALTGGHAALNPLQEAPKAWGRKPSEVNDEIPF
ncbi:hypothetical protein OCH239_15365 [Roseivivax halodurans JCM 10272]|uniref:Uncharacterized protein n=1 Tax=Roseivivax halodurans JCM 10272 TaxID=1449350 RepID=X7EAQ0_9RHOB|nr:hypothetical protein [Roseivivax halodurans]ETX12915.1 hypothetical protein OCH239_15365 [Roseivivax halodurans JCM 10272]